MEIELKKNFESFDVIEFNPIYQQIRMFEPDRLALSAPGEFTIELFMPWIYMFMIAYQEQKEKLHESFSKDTKFSKVYYMKKVN